MGDIKTLVNTTQASPGREVMELPNRMRNEDSFLHDSVNLGETRYGFANRAHLEKETKRIKVVHLPMVPIQGKVRSSLLIVTAPLDEVKSMNMKKT